MTESNKPDPRCCDVPMWLQSSSEVRDRGGELQGDAIAWECLDCDRLELVAQLTSGIPCPLRPWWRDFVARALRVQGIPQSG